jgi:hypothetical protein
MALPPTLPTIQFDGGEYRDRLAQGIILRCVDGNWRASDDSPLPEQFLCFGITKGLQRWEDGRPVEEIKKVPGEDLPDVDTLNAAVPQAQWEDGINGKRPPWQLNYVVYLLSVDDAQKYTFINATVGARIAAARLLDRIDSMQMMKGPNVIPIVTLASRPMKTSFGQKLRPHFEIVDWRDLGPATPAVPQPSAAPRIGKPVSEPTLSEEMDDSCPF